jgi:hypothetical protein
LSLVAKDDESMVVQKLILSNHTRSVLLSHILVLNRIYSTHSDHNLNLVYIALTNLVERLELFVNFGLYQRAICTN